MSNWSPVWSVTIGGIDYTDITLANLSITSGRTDFYVQPAAGYCSVEIINLDDEMKSGLCVLDFDAVAHICHAFIFRRERIEVFAVILGHDPFGFDGLR